jgi:hypothetical protein
VYFINKIYTLPELTPFTLTLFSSPGSGGQEQPWWRSRFGFG